MLDKRADYLSHRPAFIAQHDRPALLAPIAQTVAWLQQQIPGHAIHCGLSFGGSFCQRHGEGWDIWIDIQDIAHGIAQGVGNYAGIMEAIALHEISHIGGTAEAGAWARAKALRCKIPKPVASAREMQNAESFYLASHTLGRCPSPSEWTRLELPKPAPQQAPKQAPRRLLRVMPMGNFVRQVIRYG